MSQDPFYGNFNPITAPNFFMGGADPFMLSAQAAASYGLQYQPMAHNQLGTNLGFNIPGLGPLGQMGAMVGSQIMSANGYTFGSLYGGPNSNVMRNRYEMQQMQMASMAAMQRAGGSVLQQRMTNMGINLARQSGASQADADAYGQQWGSMASSLMTNPLAITGMNVLGAMTGVDLLGNLAPEAAMAQGLFRAGLTTYTGGGSFGLTPEVVANMTGRLADAFYPGGKGDASLLRGFNGRQIGNIAVALQQTGVLGSYRTDSTQFTGSDRQLYQAELERTGDRSQAISSVNAEAMKGKIKEATRVFQIARELTGSDDVNQMMQAIQTLTGGGMSVMSASAIEGQLSKIQEIARVARLSLDQMAFIAQQGSKMAESVGLSGTVGANAAISMVEKATLAYAASNYSLGGQASPYNITQGQMIDQNARQMQGALGSAMFQRLAAFEGALDQAERVTPGLVDSKIAGLRARKAAGGSLTTQEEQALAVMDRRDRIRDHTSTRADYQAMSGQEGVTELSKAISTLTGLSEGEARRVITQDRVTADIGAQKSPWLASWVATDANAFERQGQLERALAGQSEINNIKGLSTDQRRDLVTSLADLTVNNTTGGKRYRDRAAEIKQKFGLSDEDMLSLQLFSETRLGYVTNGSLQEIASLKARGEGRANESAWRAALARGMASNQALRDIGGTDFLDQLAKVAGGESSIAEALGGIKDETLRRAFQDPLERLTQASSQLNNATTQAERDAAQARRDKANKRYDEIEAELSKTGIDAPTAERREALKAEQDQQRQIKQNSDATLQRKVVTEAQMQDLVRQQEQANTDLLGLLQGERTTVGAPSGVTDVPPPQHLPAAGEAQASAAAKPVQVAGKLDVTLNGITGTAIMELAERNTPGAITNV